MSNNSWIIKSDFAYCDDKKKIITAKNSFLICENGKSMGIYKSIPKKYLNFKLYDYSGKLTIPGMIDLHLHAPQYSFRGLHMDKELLDWLNEYTFPEEAKYKNINYAKKAYSIFANELKRSATTRAVMFSSSHKNSTLVLMDEMEKTGLISYVGKVNMDINAPKNTCDKTCQSSIKDTLDIIDKSKKYKRTKPILTPRFVIACSKKLLEEIGKIAKTHPEIPIQSHLSENINEIITTNKMYPSFGFYGNIYNHFGLFGNTNNTIMAHCVYSDSREINLMKSNGIYIAHCPKSNENLTSGIAPIRKYIDRGLRIGLGSDVAGGESESIFSEIVNAIDISKLYSVLVDKKSKPITFAEAFYLATLGGGSFFGKVGSFLKGYEVDAIVLNDTKNKYPYQLSVEERLESSVYLTDGKDNLVHKFVAGIKII